MIIICEILTFKPGTQQLFSEIWCHGVPLERRDQSEIRVFNMAGKEIHNRTSGKSQQCKNTDHKTQNTV